MRDACGNVGKVAAAAEVIGHGHARIVLAGQSAIDRDFVVIAGMRHRANDGDLIGLARDQRHVLAEVEARNRGAAGPELAANAGRRLQLHVPHVLLRRPAPEKQEDTGFGPGLRRAGRTRSSLQGRSGQQLRQRQRPEPHLAKLDQSFSAMDHVAAVLRVLSPRSQLHSNSGKPIGRILPAGQIGSQHSGCV